MYLFTLLYILHHFSFSYASLQSSFTASQVLQNRMLTRSVTASRHFCVLNNVDWMECISRCNSDNNCISYNFDLPQEICWLNAYGLTDYCNEKDLVYNGGTVFQQLREDKVRSLVNCIKRLIY